jgi:hypothetical protein
LLNAAQSNAAQHGRHDEGERMAREAILEAVRRNVRRPAVVLPPFLPAGERAVARYEGEPPVAHFVRRLEAIGGRRLEIAGLFAEIPESRFRLDTSSTELRART